jgi:hypothetical protein
MFGPEMSAGTVAAAAAAGGGGGTIVCYEAENFQKKTLTEIPFNRFLSVNRLAIIMRPG